MTDIFNKNQINKSKENSKIGYIKAIILSIIISSIPFILFTLLYKTPFILDSELWKLILVSIPLTITVLIINYYLVNLRKITEIFLDPIKLANEFSKPAKMSQIVMNGHKKKKKKEVVVNENRHQEMLTDKITSKLSMKNKENWYNASVRINSVFSTVVIASYYLNIKQYLFINLLLAELLIFISPLIIDFIKIKSMTSAVMKTQKNK